MGSIEVEEVLSNNSGITEGIFFSKLGFLSPLLRLK
jgi:hypothetical protein